MLPTQRLERRRVLPTQRLERIGALGPYALELGGVLRTKSFERRRMGFVLRRGRCGVLGAQRGDQGVVVVVGLITERSVAFEQDHRRAVGVELVEGLADLFHRLQ